MIARRPDSLRNKGGDTVNRKIGRTEKVEYEDVIYLAGDGIEYVHYAQMTCVGKRFRIDRSCGSEYADCPEIEIDGNTRRYKKVHEHERQRLGGEEHASENTDVIPGVACDRIYRIAFKILFAGEVREVAVIRVQERKRDRDQENTEPKLGLPVQEIVAAPHERCGSGDKVPQQLRTDRGAESSFKTARDRLRDRRIEAGERERHEERRNGQNILVCSVLRFRKEIGECDREKERKDRDEAEVEVRPEPIAQQVHHVRSGVLFAPTQESNDTWAGFWDHAPHPSAPSPLLLGYP